MAQEQEAVAYTHLTPAQLSFHLGRLALDEFTALRHSPGAEDGRRWHISWINPTVSEVTDAGVKSGPILENSLILHKVFCILFSINGQKNSTHILPLMMQSGKTSVIWSPADTATQFDAYTNVNVLTPLWKLCVCEQLTLTHFLWALGCIHFPKFGGKQPGQGAGRRKDRK